MTNTSQSRLRYLHYLRGTVHGHCCFLDCCWRIHLDWCCCCLSCLPAPVFPRPPRPDPPRPPRLLVPRPAPRPPPPATAATTTTAMTTASDRSPVASVWHPLIIEECHTTFITVRGGVRSISLIINQIIICCSEGARIRITVMGVFINNVSHECTVSFLVTIQQEQRSKVFVLSSFDSCRTFRIRRKNLILGDGLQNLFHCGVGVRREWTPDGQQFASCL
jgi:hypothetical protein